MSQWTHVIATFRVQGIDHPMFPQINWQNRMSKNVPHGSEGPLQIVVNVSRGFGRVDTVVTVWGDLRDYDDEAEIMTYFTSIIPTPQQGAFIGEGVVSIRIEEYGDDPEREYHYKFVGDGTSGAWMPITS